MLAIIQLNNIILISLFYIQPSLFLQSTSSLTSTLLLPIPNPPFCMSRPSSLCPTLIFSTANPHILYVQSMFFSTLKPHPLAPDPVVPNHNLCHSYHTNIYCCLTLIVSFTFYFRLKLHLCYLSFSLSFSLPSSLSFLHPLTCWIDST